MHHKQVEKAPASLMFRASVSELRFLFKGFLSKNCPEVVVDWVLSFEMLPTLFLAFFRINESDGC